ncbi:MAG: PD40 domain-containing protein, partial [Bacteroidales bacterium]|nr:PD40 domain-containing protein [Bacteroidales bacterium]
NDEYYYYLGKAFMFDLKIDKALTLFNQYKAKGINQSRDNTVERLIEMCHNAQQLIQKPVNVKFENLGSKVNSSLDDYLPFVLNDNTLFFTSNKHFDKDFELYTQNVYASSFLNHTSWTLAKNSKKLNSEENEELVFMSPDKHTIFIRANFYEEYSKILLAQRKTKSFNYKTEMDLQTPFLFKSHQTGASYDTENKVIYISYYTKENPNEDIYVINQKPDGSWGQPQSISDKINTIYAERYPLISDDGNRLYFASKGHNSMGGFDIFYSDKDTSGNWSEPKNMGYPINSTFDDFSICFTRNGQCAFVAANRKEGYGGKDIYYLIFNEKETQLTLLKVKVFVENGDKLKSFNNHQGNQSIEVKDNYGNVFAKYHLLKNKNRFVAILSPGTYQLIVNIEGFKSFVEKFTIEGGYKFVDMIEKNINIVPENR